MSQDRPAIHELLRKEDIVPRTILKALTRYNTREYGSTVSKMSMGLHPPRHPAPHSLRPPQERQPDGLAGVPARSALPTKSKTLLSNSAGNGKLRKLRLSRRVSRC